MPALPQSNGLVEITGAKQKEKGFCCMKLIAFLVRDGVNEWDEWHGAHQQAAQHCCPYKNECDMHKKTIT